MLEAAKRNAGTRARGIVNIRYEEDTGRILGENARGDLCQLYARSNIDEDDFGFQTLGRTTYWWMEASEIIRWMTPEQFDRYYSGEAVFFEDQREFDEDEEKEGEPHLYTRFRWGR